jgi:hypothetical protein
MLLARGNIDEGARNGLATILARLERRPSRDDVVDLVFLVRGLMVPGAGGQDVQAGAQARNTEELEPGLTRRPLTLKELLEIEGGPPHPDKTGHSVTRNERAFKEPLPPWTGRHSRDPDTIG